jgi:hypothetical protein
MLKNIQAARNRIYVHLTGRISYTDLIRVLPGSLSQVIDKGYIASDKGNIFHITTGDGTTQAFKKSDTGLYFLDRRKEHKGLLVNTVMDNEYKYCT